MNSVCGLDVFKNAITSNIVDLKENGRAYIYTIDVLNETKRVCDAKKLKYKEYSVYDEKYKLNYYILTLEKGE